MSGIYVLGGGGHAKMVIACLRASGQEVAGVLDDADRIQHGNVLNAPVLGKFHELRGLSHARAIIAIGDNRVRANIAARFSDVEWVSAIHPAATVHESVLIGSGSVISAGSILQPDVVVGEHAIVNTAASIDHDSVIGNFVHIAPGCHLAGSVWVGEGAFIGIGAVVVPQRQVGAWAVVGAASAVVRNIPADTIALGVPARVRPQENIQ